MGVLRGYDLNIGASAVVDLMGTLNNGPVSSTNLTRGTLPQSGWQLLGNPYPSPLDFSQTAGIASTNMDDAVYVYQSTGQYAGPVPQLCQRHGLVGRFAGVVHAGLL